MSFQVAITVDAEHGDRPARPGNDERLLDALAAAGIRATFFIQGRWAEANPAVARRIAVDGHLVGSHTFYHARLPLLTPEGIAADMRDAEAAICEHAGVDPRPWFRCPFGAGALDPGLLAQVAATGYPKHAGWDVDTQDWRPGLTPEELTAIVVDGATRRGDGAVVLMHSWPDPTPFAVAEIVRQLGDAGAVFVTMADLPDPTSHIPADDPQ